MTTKSEWRKELRRRRASLGDCRTRESRLSEALSKVLSANRGLWLSFVPMKDEPQFQSSSGRFAYPKICDDTSMTFFVTERPSTSRWTLNSLGFQEPDPSDGSWSEVDTQNRVADDLCGDLVGALVPGLGFDTQLNRLGRGRGFYDRYFSKLKTEGRELIKLGVGFHEQVVDELPCDLNDISMDGLVTDREVIWNPAAKFDREGSNQKGFSHE